MQTHKVLSIFVALAAVHCGGENRHAYAPTEQATATVSGLPAARYGVPPEQPTGSVVVASSGVTELKPNPDTTTQALFLRMVIANNTDDAPWVIDSRQQLVTVPGHGASRPAYVNTDVPTASAITVARGERRTVDLYYPLPDAAVKKLPAFDFSWQVQTARRLVAERTPFERVEQRDDYYAYNPYYYGSYYPGGYYPGAGLWGGGAWGWGPYWAYDPLWPRATFINRTVIVRPEIAYGHRPAVKPFGGFSHRPEPSYGMGGYGMGGYGIGGGPRSIAPPMSRPEFSAPPPMVSPGPVHRPGR